jgi:hypothetical protein
MKALLRTLSVCVVCVSLTSVATEAQEIEENLERGVIVKTHVIAGSVGVPGVTMEGLPGDPMSDSNGQYSAIVPAGFSGTVMPRREGYQFAPPCRMYESLADDHNRESYAARIIQYTISGHTGVAGTMIQGLPGNPMTDARGYYTVHVSYGWSGKVTPLKAGHVFDPPAVYYARVSENRSNQNFAAQVQMLTISDRIVFSDATEDHPISGVVVTIVPGDHTDLTDAEGWYHVKVPYGWSGELTMVKEGFNPDPPTIPYRNVVTDMVERRPVPSSQGRYVQAPRPRGGASFPSSFSTVSADEVLVIPTRQVMTEAFAETADDMRVMAHILREELSEPRAIRGVLYDYGDFFSRPDRAVKAICLQGYGALFVIHLDTPFSFSQDSPVVGENETGPVLDPVWQRARERLHGARPSGTRWPVQDEKVSFEQFKEDLLKTLKHTANIRHIDPNEQITLTVIGQSDPATGMASVPGGRSNRAGGYSPYSSGFGGARPSVVGSGRGQTPIATVLTIQVPKALVDAYARGDLDFEQFQEKAKTFSY